MNRPHPELSLEEILDGLREFSKQIRGRLITETMLVHELNSSVEELEPIASLIEELKPHGAYISIPIRPPAESFVRPPHPGELVRAHEIFSVKLGEERVEILNMPEPLPETVIWDPESWLLSTTSVHPLRLDYALRVLSSRTEDPEGVIRRLESMGLISIVEYSGARFIVKMFRSGEMSNFKSG